MKSNIIGGRLVKVLLPGDLVQAMDEIVAEKTGYTTRNEFIADAVQGHLVELMALRGNHSCAVASAYTTEESGDETMVAVNSAARNALDLRTSIGPVPAGAATLERTPRKERGPTWGMHNRDFPTLWALWQLAEASGRVGSPVPLKGWTEDTVQMAWRLSQELPASRYDTSGFPANPAKREAAEGRFVRFFLGTEGGEGPLFDLALAGIRRGTVAPTEAGLALLRSLEGFGCERDQVVKRAWTEAYLRHLDRHARADVDFMEEVLRLVAGGAADRTGLVEAVGTAHPNWSGSVLETNVAGFIARGREWGLIRQKQQRGKYVLEEGGLEIATQRLRRGAESDDG